MECASLGKKKEYIMKNKFYLTAVIACALMCANCSEENKKETTKTENVHETETEIVMTTTPDIHPKGEPKASETSRGTLKLLAAASSKNMDYSVNKKFVKDIDKVLKDVSGLRSTGKTVLGGRRGRAASGFNDGSTDGSAGISDGLGSLLGGSAVAASAPKTHAKRSFTSEKSTPRLLLSKSASLKKSVPAASHDVYLVSDSDESESWDDDESASRKEKKKYRHSNDQKSGLLTAGEWNDLEHWSFWTELLNDNNYYDKLDYWKFFPKKLVAVKVVDGNNVDVPNVPVILLNGKKVEFVTKTDNAGNAYCWINLFDNNNQYSRPKDFWLIVDGVEINGNLKITGKNDRKLNMNIVVDKTAKIPKAMADIAFIVDATGSMSDEINFLKSDLSYIIERARFESNIELRTAALFYRDKGDIYLTRHDDFTDDVSQTQEYVSKQKANGGGDYPEAVHSALEASLRNLSWDESARARVAFLILDAPAHYEDEVIKSLQESISLYAKRGIKLIPVAASGVDKHTEFMLRFFDLATGGTYVFLTDDSGIGNSHIKASVGNYKVERLADLMIRLIKKNVE